MARNVATLHPPAILVLAGLAAAGLGIANMLSWRAVKAKKLYLDHCDVALANPQLSDPTDLKLDFEAQTADGSGESFERYEWYVARLVYALDEILSLNPADKWYAAARTQLGNHRDYFASDYYAEQNYLSHYGPRIRELIEELRSA